MPSYHGGRHGFSAEHCARRRLKRVTQAVGPADGRHLLDIAVQRVWHGEFEYDLLGWSQSALNRLTSDPNLFFETLTGRGKPTRGKAAGGKCLAHLLLGTLLSGPALLPTWWSMLAGRAGTLTLAAQKRGSPPTHARSAVSICFDWS